MWKFENLKGHQSINFSIFQKSALSDLDPSPEHILTHSNTFHPLRFSRNRVPTCFWCLRNAAILDLTYFRNFYFRLFSFIPWVYILNRKPVTKILFEKLRKQNFRIFHLNGPVTLKSRSRSLKLGQSNQVIGGYPHAKYFWNQTKKGWEQKKTSITCNW